MSDYQPGFLRWWALFPSSRRRDKVKCGKLWKTRNLEDRAPAIIEKLEADLEFDEQWKKGYIPLTHSYLHGGRYDDDKPRRPRVNPVVRREEQEQNIETDPYVASVKRVAVVWLWRRHGIPDDRMKVMEKLVRTLADDAREKHQQGQLTDKYAQVIRDELDDMVKRGAVK